MNDKSDLQDWIKQFMAEEAVRAKSLLVTVWGDSIAPFGGKIWLSDLIRLLQPFAVSERLVRTSVFRLADEGWINPQRQGRRSQYELTPSGSRRVEHAGRRIYQPPPAKWERSWTLVVAINPRLTAEQRQELRRDLNWEGYGVIAPGVFGHPMGDTQILEEILSGLGIRDLVVVFDGLKTNVDEPVNAIIDMVQQSWSLDALARRYSALIERFNPVLASVWENLEAEDAFVIRTLLIHAYRRILLHDPHLPMALLPDHWPGRVAYQMCATIYRRIAPSADAHIKALLKAGGLDSSSLNRNEEERFAMELPHPS